MRTGRARAPCAPDDRERRSARPCSGDLSRGRRPLAPQAPLSPVRRGVVRDGARRRGRRRAVDCLAATTSFARRAHRRSPTRRQAHLLLARGLPRQRPDPERHRARRRRPRPRAQARRLSDHRELVSCDSHDLSDHRELRTSRRPASPWHAPPLTPTPCTSSCAALSNLSANANWADLLSFRAAHVTICCHIALRRCLEFGHSSCVRTRP